MLHQLETLVKQDYPEVDISYPTWASKNGNPVLHMEYVVPNSNGSESVLIGVENKGRVLAHPAQTAEPDGNVEFFL